MWRRWNELSGPERYEFWARAGLYLPFAVALLFDLTLARAQQVRVPGLVVFLLLAVGQAGACAVLLHASVSRYLARGPAPRRWLVAAAIALTAAGVLAGAAAFPAFTRPPVGAFPVSMFVAMLFGGTLTVALAPLLRTRALLAVVLVGAAAASGMSASIGGGRRRRPRAGARRGISDLCLLHRRLRCAHRPRLGGAAADHVGT